VPRHGATLAARSTSLSSLTAGSLNALDSTLLNALQ
jgi:hypothetical protein